MASSDVLPVLEAAPMKRHRPEQQIQKALADHLRARAAAGTYWLHPANGGARTATNGRARPTERAAHGEMRAAGAEIAVVVGIDAALRCLESWGLLRAQTQ
jgi:hypothetical protein